MRNNLTNLLPPWINTRSPRDFTLDLVSLGLCFHSPYTLEDRLDYLKLSFMSMDRGYLEELRTSKILAIVATFSILALITVILRLYTLLLVIKNVSPDDLCIALAVVRFV